MTEALAALLAGEMRRRGWNQAELARFLGAKQQSVSRWMDDTNPTRPSVESCYVIADRLEVDPQNVLQLAGHVPEGSERPLGFDPDWELIQHELRAIFESFERSKWQDLTRTFESVAKLTRPDVPRDPSEHQGNAEGRDNVKSRDLAAGWLDWQGIGLASRTSPLVKLTASPVLV